MPIKTSSQLTLGANYSREQLRNLFGIKDASLRNGIFQPAGHDSVWLFITAEKTPDRTQYEDRLEGNDLYFEGQTKGRTDALIKEHRERGLEVILFYRTQKDERPDYSFKFEGQFEYLSAEAGPPTKFHLRRIGAIASPIVELQAVVDPSQIRENVRRFMQSEPDSTDGTLSLIRQTSNWVFDAEHGVFGPATFVGLQRMTFDRYVAAIAGRSAGTPIDGELARVAIESLLGPFKPSELLGELLRTQLEATVGHDGADPTKWAFVVVPSTRNFWALLCRPEVFDVVPAAQSLDELSWTVNRGEFQAGDRVAIWQARGGGTERGIVAVAEVIRGVQVEPVPPAELKFWRAPDTIDRERIRLRPAHGGALPLWESTARPWLSKLAVAKARGGMVFTLAPEEWYAITAAARLDLVPGLQAHGTRRAARQGFGLTPAERRAVECHAQQLAEQHFLSLGFEVEDVSAIDCYDLHCTNPDGQEVRVEVKGTTGCGEAVILTRNEVRHAREEASRMALVIVSGIQLERLGNESVAKAGKLVIHWPWVIDDGQLDPRQFDYRPRELSAQSDAEGVKPLQP